jgi:hypothetical protein
MATGGADMPPAWQQGASVQPEAPAPAPQPDLMAYFRAMRPELFSQEAVGSAMESDAATNARNAGLRRMESGAAGYGLRAPNYAGMEPTDAGMKGLQARQQQAMLSAEVGSKVGQFQQTAQQSQEMNDPKSRTSRNAYGQAMLNKDVAPLLVQAFPGGPGTASAADIQAFMGRLKEGAGYSDTVAGTGVKVADAGEKRAKTGEIETLLPGKEKGQKLANQNAALLPGKTQAEIDKLRADIAAGKNVTATNAGKRTQELRKEFEAKPQVTNAATINTAHGNITHANDDGFGDLTMIYSYIKLLDPTTGVRESEMANAQRTGGYIDQLRIMAEKPKNGRYLTPEMRASLKAQADNLLRDANASYDREAASFSGLAEKENLNPSDVVTPKGYSAPGGSAGNADSEAVKWAKANPGDPRAAEILRVNGVK